MPTLTKASLSLLLVAVAFAQTPAKSPTEVEQLKAELAAKDTQILVLRAQLETFIQSLNGCIANMSKYFTVPTPPRPEPAKDTPEAPKGTP